MRILITVFSFVLTLVLNAACQSPCDPHKGGFISGIHGLVSGCYEDRIAAKEQEVQNELKKQQKLDSEAKKQQEELTSLQNKLEQASERLATLEASIQHHRLRLEQEKRLKASDEAELQEVESELNALKKMVAEAKIEKHSANKYADDINRLADYNEQVGLMIEEITGGEVPSRLRAWAFPLVKEKSFFVAI